MNPLEVFIVILALMHAVVIVGERIHAWGAHRGWWSW